MLPPTKTKDTRDRFWLYEKEVDRLITAANSYGRHRLRDATLILSCFTHALRTKELINLRWNQVDWDTGTLYVKRVKNGIDSSQPIRGKEMRAFRQLQKDYPDSPFIFTSSYKAPLATRTVREIIARAGEIAELEIRPRPHMLRHACGYYLANVKKQDLRVIKDYMGHRNISNTVIYTRLSSDRFDDFWRD